MGNLFSSATPSVTSKRVKEDEYSEFESNVKKQKHYHDTNNPPYRIRVEGLFEFRVDHPQEHVDPTWWKAIETKVRKNLNEIQTIIQEYDKTCACLIKEALQPYKLSKDDISVCPFDYDSKPTIEKDMIFSLEKGAIIPAKKYEHPLKYFKDSKSSNYQQVSVFQSISGSGKTHFSNVIIQELDMFCFIISPNSKVYRDLELYVRGIFCEKEVSRDRLDRICDLFIMSHIILLLMVLQGTNKISKRDFLLFQKNGGNMHIKEIFNSLLNFGEAKLDLLNNIEMAWCVDEAHVFSYVLKRRVPHTNSQKEMGSLLTSLTGSCRKYGPTFLTSTITGLITEIKSDIPNMYSIKQQEKEFSLPTLWPIDSQQMLSQVMNFPDLSTNSVASYVCNQLIGPPRLTVSYFNMLVYEANKKKSTNVEELLLTALYKTFSVIHITNRNQLPIAERYLDWKNSGVWDPLLDQLILFGSVTAKQMPSKELFEKLIQYGVCFDHHKSSNQMFLASIEDKVQVIDKMKSVDGDWLNTLWKIVSKVLEREKLAELLLNHMLIAKFDDCIGVVLKDHPIFKNYTLMSKYWFHDIPFSKESTDKNINRKSSLLLKLISSHFNIRTSSMQNWNNTNAKWVSDLPPNSVTFYPNSNLSPIDFVIRPTTEAGPDLVGILVRTDYAQFLSQPQAMAVNWIKNDMDLPPYIPITASCTIEREGEELKNKIKDILSTRLTSMYNSSNNEQAKKERILIEKDAKTISPYCVRVVFAPIATESLSTILNEDLPIENVKETEDDGVIIMFSKHLTSFENYLENETAKQIISHLGEVFQN